MDYVRTDHSKHSLLVHLIFVCKYRKELLVHTGEDMKEIFRDISLEHQLKIIEMEADKDHIHLLVQYSPVVSVLDIVRWYKQVSTYRIWRSKWENYLQEQFWKEQTFWSDGYFACSTGQVSHETIEKYIREQG